jgi:hypothetical protein
VSSQVSQVLNEVVAGIKLLLPELPTCKRHSGRFGLSEVRTLANQAPAVLVSCLRIQPQTGTASSWSANCALFILTRDAKELPRDRSALFLAENLALYLRHRRFAQCEAIVNVDAQNLYATELEGIGVSLWGVTFVQPLQRTNDLKARQPWGDNEIPTPLPRVEYLGL